MANELQENLDKILEDKNTNLLSSNLKKNVTCLGISGELESTDWSNLKSLYYFCNQGYNLDMLPYLNTSNVVTMEFMFRGATTNKDTDEYLTSLDLSNFETGSTQIMDYMFYDCSQLTDLNVSNFDTSNVTDMSYMFYNCGRLTSLDVSNFDTSNVTSMWGMFYGCNQLTDLNVSNFNIGNVTSMGDMFYNCERLTSLDVSNFDTSNVTSMYRVFGACSNLTSLNLIGWKTDNVTDFRWMFNKCTSLTELDLSSFTGTTDVGSSSSSSGSVSAKNVYCMFYDCTGLQTLDISGLDWRGTSNNIFNNCTALKTVYVKDEDSKTACDTALSAAGLSITSTIKE